MLALTESPPQLTQLAQQQQRVGAVQHEFRAGSKMDQPLPHRARVNSRTSARTGFAASLGRNRIASGRLLLRPSRQMPHLGQNLRTGRRICLRRPGLALLEHGANLIQRGEGEIDQLRADLEPPVAYLVKGVLKVVGEGGQVLEAEHCPGTLDGVQGAKGASHELLVTGVLVQFQEC